MKKIWTDLSHRFFALLCCATLLAFVSISCKQKSHSDTENSAKVDSLKTELHTLLVKATAYNSTIAQTDSINPFLTAFGDTLEPGMKAIAVSRDLLRMGLTHNTAVHIEGLDGPYLVKDKMHSRHRKKIDIYMGNDIAKARHWGVQQVLISWTDTIPVASPAVP